MNLKTLRNQKGFTIVEVVLVLAIAGLIFLIVFLALPQLQKSRRDTARRSDLGRAAAALEQYASNRNGDYPAEIDDDFVDDYLDGNFNDPSSGDSYADDSAGFRYTRGASCSAPDAEAPSSGSGTRRWALSIDLESGPHFCQDSE